MTAGQSLWSNAITGILPSESSWNAYPSARSTRRCTFPLE